MKTQPICVIYFPNDFSFGQGGLLVRPLELTNELNGWNEGSKGESLGNYLWFCFFKENITEPEFKVFYEKDFTEIQYQELKQLVKDSIKQKEEEILISGKDCKDFCNSVQPLDERELNFKKNKP